VNKFPLEHLGIDPVAVCGDQFFTLLRAAALELVANIMNKIGVPLRAPRIRKSCSGRALSGLSAAIGNTPRFRQ